MGDATRAADVARQFLPLLGLRRPADATRALDAAPRPNSAKAAGRWVVRKCSRKHPGCTPVRARRGRRLPAVAPLQAFTDGTAHPVR
ncbi:hypothetical protein GS416_06175 [Rhodococcus hoagii]|nr:hypothetical protein [Prescottella equi]